MKNISPKHIQHLWAHQKATHTHPQPVRKRRQRERNDEVGEERGHEYDEGFASEQVEEEPHYPGEEGAGRGAEIIEPVRYYGKD